MDDVQLMPFAILFVGMLAGWVVLRLLAELVAHGVWRAGCEWAKRHHRAKIVNAGKFPVLVNRPGGRDFCVSQPREVLPPRPALPPPSRRPRPKTRGTTPSKRSRWVLPASCRRGFWVSDQSSG